jgi:hypothetical protein
LKESVLEIMSEKSKSPLEDGGEHHNFFGTGCQDVIPCDRSPLEHGTIQEKVILTQFGNLAFIHDGLLE